MPSFDIAVNSDEAVVASTSPQAEEAANETGSDKASEEKQASLFKEYDKLAIAAKPVEKTAEGHSNIINRLDQLQARSARPSAVSKSRAVQRAVSYTVRGKRYTTLADSDGFVQTGRASWYGKRFHGRKTASGERFDMNALTAAHKELPLGTKIEVINNSNGKSVVVTVNDRGPFHGNRVLDLSREAARQLGVIQKGTANVTIRAL
ncbi:septal ring lytic transglycosylase RlpA family protein [Cardiobacteriaceae bacterium TAE3-ERU3]|nr:septal ring lytic transglycosylase RlpA family protein [Cardiobacteriaceae bacterium TAE3-ERU3]